MTADLSTQTYLTLAEAAEYARSTTPEAFRKWARRARLPYCRRGRLLLYRRVDIDRAIDVRLRAVRPAKGAAA